MPPHMILSRRVFIFLIGKPGAGKSTQGKLLGARFELPYVSLGDLVRDEILLGRGPKQEHVSNDEHMQFLNLALAHINKGCVLDGFTRTESQVAQVLSRLLATDVLIAIVLHLPELHARERIHERTLSSKRTKEDATRLQTRFLRFDSNFKAVVNCIEKRANIIELHLQQDDTVESIHQHLCSLLLCKFSKVQ